MRYFKYELWKKMNSKDQVESNNALSQWEQNDKEYYKLFERVKKKLPVEFLQVYLVNHGFHDFKIESIQVIHEKYGIKQPIKVIIIITDESNKLKIKYDEISKIQIDYMCVNDSRADNRGFDDWGYDEFLIVDRKTISHEILFASGAKLLLHFNKISIDKL